MHEVKMNYVSDNQPMKLRKAFQEHCVWCNERVGKRSRTAKRDEFLKDTESQWYVDWTDSSRTGVSYVFKDVQMAVLFKLTCGGQ